jgi:hypothetical protein
MPWRTAHATLLLAAALVPSVGLVAVLGAFGAVAPAYAGSNPFDHFWDPADMQAGTMVLPFLGLPLSARAAALGGQEIGLEEDALSAVQQPARLGLVRGYWSELTHAEIQGEWRQEGGAVTLPLGGGSGSGSGLGSGAGAGSAAGAGYGAIGLDARVLMATDFENAATIEEELHNFQAVDAAFGVSYGRALGPVRVGVRVAWLRSAIEEASGTSWSGDFGMELPLGRWVTLGGSVRNLSTGFRYEGGPREELPTELGVRATGRVDWGAGAGAGPLDERPLAWGVSWRRNRGGGHYASAGVEQRLFDFLDLRLGYELPLEEDEQGWERGMTGGFGLRLLSVRLDYGFQWLDQLGPRHFVSVNFRPLEKPAPVERDTLILARAAYRRGSCLEAEPLARVVASRTGERKEAQIEALAMLQACRKAVMRDRGEAVVLLHLRIPEGSARVGPWSVLSGRVQEVRGRWENALLVADGAGAGASPTSMSTVAANPNASSVSGAGAAAMAGAGKPSAGAAGGAQDVAAEWGRASGGTKGAIGATGAPDAAGGGEQAANPAELWALAGGKDGGARAAARPGVVPGGVRDEWIAAIRAADSTGGTGRDMASGRSGESEGVVANPSMPARSAGAAPCQLLQRLGVSAWLRAPDPSCILPPAQDTLADLQVEFVRAETGKTPAPSPAAVPAGVGTAGRKLRILLADKSANAERWLRAGGKADLVVLEQGDEGWLRPRRLQGVLAVANRSKVMGQLELYFDGDTVLTWNHSWVGKEPARRLDTLLARELGEPIEGILTWNDSLVPPASDGFAYLHMPAGADGYDVRFMASGAGGDRRLTKAPGDYRSPRPAGTRGLVAFVRRDGERLGAWVQRSDQREAVPLSTSGLRVLEARWDARENWLLVGGVDDGGYGVVRRILPDGSGEEELLRLQGWLVYRVEPSPVGSGLAVEAMIGDLSAVFLQGGVHSAPQRISSQEQQAWRPKYSPDGERIAFLARPLQATDTVAGLMVWNSRDGSAQRIEGVGSVRDFCWLPDGRGLVVASGLEVTDLQAVDLETGGARRLTQWARPRAASESGPQLLRWEGADGVLFQREAEGRSEIVWVPLAGGEERLLVDLPGRLLLTP